MSGSDRIDAYVAELGRVLHASRRERGRILTEVEDHLRESAAVCDVDEALRRFGSADVVAARFRIELAADAAAWTVRVLAVALVAFVGLCGVLQSRAVQAASPRSLDAPVGPLTLVLLEVSWVTAAITAARWRRWRLAAAVPPDVALAVARGAWVAAAAAFAGGALQFVALVTGPAVHGWAYAVIAGWLATALTSSVVFAATAVARGRARRAGASGPGDAFEDIIALAARFSRVERVPARVAHVVAPFDPRRHSWRFAAGFALAVGIAFAELKGVGEPDAGSVLAAVRGGAELAGAQAGAILVAYAALGRFLGLRPTQRARS